MDQNSAFIGVTKQPFGYENTGDEAPPVDQMLCLLDGDMYDNERKSGAYANYACVEGDIVKCTVDRVQGQLRFCINGEDKGIALRVRTSSQESCISSFHYEDQNLL